MRVGPVVSVLLSNIVPASFRGSTTTPWKVARAIKLFSPGGEGQLYPYKGRYLADGVTVELAGGHNRTEAMRRLKLKSAMIQIIEDCTDAQFFEMYVKDNSKADTQVTEWALGVIAAAPDAYGAEYARRGLPVSKMYSDLQDEMGIPELHMTALREALDALNLGIIPAEFVKVADIGLAAFLWRRIKSFGLERINKELLLELINDIKGKDGGETQTRRVRDIIKKWREQLVADVPTDGVVRLVIQKHRATLQEKLARLSNQIRDLISAAPSHKNESMELEVLETLRQAWTELDALLPGDDDEDEEETEVEVDQNPAIGQSEESD